MSMKNFSDIIGNRTRDLPTCNTVPQPTAPPHDPGVCSTVFICKCIIPYIVVTTGVVSTPIPLVCSALWGEGSDYNLVPTPKGHYLLK